jgi:MFS family permease
MVYGQCTLVFCEPSRTELFASLARHYCSAILARANAAGTKISTRKLIGRLWLTNSVNRYGVDSTEIATLYSVANLLTAVSYIAAPRVAHRLGAVRAIVFTRLGTILFMAAMALSPTFLLASVAYTVRIMINSIGLPIRQSFVMGVAEEQSRSRVAAIGSLPSQATGMIAPTIASHLMLSVSMVAPIRLAAIACTRTKNYN